MSNDKAAAASVLIAALVAAQPASAAQHAHHRGRAAVPQPKIACTVVGCIRVPAGCEPVEGRTPGGIPTGFDVIACPPRRR